ncbi:uncharacterized protein LOC129803189 isoform X2 [Phlebotomus papatasi]|uniref:uncharacterized protein LOC129803189 isoform X2 n=1 Tax=Phlebotomus papatasi TaxID=29031 RepID=UPI00248442F3|nr:uncharacterized protein LOC129803189 isoform X2 [Phlebotomus papatasi]XP_055705565.1 uncharacterized protein LOC129803189 isoform X2 [Phlebotomus papatasi]
MVKKGTKKKTKWHSLPMEETSGATPVTVGNHRDQTFVDKPFSAWRLNTKSSSTSSQTSTQSNGDNSTKIPSETSNNSHVNGYHQPVDHPTRPPSHRRRNYQNSYHGGGRHYGQRVSSSTNYRNSYSGQSTNNRENSKLTFNEDEYTRITTPRQDVLFKKGYLSRPKRFTPFNNAPISDPATTPSSSGSGAVSVTSMDDSATPSTQSVTPEHCHSTSEPSDGDYPFMYPGFFDQNGILYVNPYTTFDPYGNGQMLMMPYAVNNLGSMDMYNTPLKPYDAPCSSIDSQITSPGSASPHNEESPEGTPPIAEESTDEAVDDENKSEISHLNPDSTNFYPQSIPPIPPLYHPPTTFFYTPYIIGSQMMPLCDDALAYNDLLPNETEDSSCINEEEKDAKTPTKGANSADNVIPQENVNGAFKSTLNVEVQEFHPRYYRSRPQPTEKVHAKDEGSAGSKDNAKSEKSRKESVGKKKPNQPYSQLVTNRKLLQEATKSIQEQNIDLLKKNSLTMSANGVPSDTKWQTVVKPRGRKGRVAFEDINDEGSDPEESQQNVENEKLGMKENEKLLCEIPQNSSPANGKNSSSKKGKPKKKSVGKKSKKQRQSVGFEVIEPDFGRIVLNKKTEITQDECEDSEVDEIGATRADEEVGKEEEVMVVERTEDNIIDVCDDAECRELEAELQHIECILNMGVESHLEDVTESENVYNGTSTSSPLPEEVVNVPEIVEDVAEASNETVEDDGSVFECREEANPVETCKEDREEIQQEVHVDIAERQKISLLEAVTQWLDEKQRMNSTEELFKLPEDPAILQRLLESAFVDMGSETSNETDSEADASDNDNSLPPPVQLKNQMSLSEDDSIDTDSDYQSDGQGKRMTSISSSESYSPQQKSPEIVKTTDSQSKLDNEAHVLTTGSPTLNVTSVNSLNHSSSNSIINVNSQNATLQNDTYTKSPVLCILM